MLDNPTKYSIILLCVAFTSIGFLLYYLDGVHPYGRSFSPTGAVIYEEKPHKDLSDHVVRVLIIPKSASLAQELKAEVSLDVRHEFGKKFSADVKRKDIPALLSKADVVEVAQYEIQLRNDWGPQGRAVCGDMTCQGNEPNSCPQDCGTTPFVRSCAPTNQKAYNTLQVNGASMSNGDGVVVAVLDTGARKDHPDLLENIALCADTTTRGARKGSCSDQSSVGHGTHTAGIIAAEGGPDGKGLIGVAPSAKLQIIRVCGASGICYADDIAEGIDYAARSGANIVSMSLGGASDSSLIRDAITRHPDILFIAAAGNSGPALDTINYPAANPGVIAVAANDIDAIGAVFSSRGIDDDNDGLISAREVELSAGGVAVESTHNDGCYSALSGTSFSTPTVAGVAAAVWDIADGTLDGKGNAASTRLYLRSIAHDVIIANGGGAESGYDVQSGYGIPVIQ
ncbi:S8 family serine peptidase [Candidatus Woesearchaeota archaeon]|nr:S8 family serine peptidase [Candidatus Woesearchaeota archaeon]